MRGEEGAAAREVTSGGGRGQSSAGRSVAVAWP